MRRCRKLPPCPIDPVPVGSKMDPQLAKPISNGDSTSVITCLRMRKNHCTTAARIDDREYVRETTLQTPRSVKKEGEKALQALKKGFPCST